MDRRTDRGGSTWITLSGLLQIRPGTDDVCIFINELADGSRWLETFTFLQQELGTSGVGVETGTSSSESPTTPR